ncbi:MAG TPA: TraB domain-containing protein [Acidobacteriota bacterium]|nr:TraB domain-containing protein [Acidobacteriota bacterium]
MLGTSHVAIESVESVKRYIDEYMPKVVCVELDKQRLQGLLANNRSLPSPRLIFHIGVVGFIFVLFGSLVQRAIAKSLGTQPGHDMLTAVRYARNNNISVALVDQPIHITLKHTSAYFTFKEGFRFFWDIVSSLFGSKRVAREIGMVNLDLSKVPSQKIIERSILYLEKRYPSIYKALIHERNVYMSERIRVISKEYPNEPLLVVVGAGHIAGMMPLLKDLTVVRL